MSFYYFKNLNLNLNGNTLFPSDIQLQSEIDILHPLNTNDRVSKKNIPNSPYKSALRIKYYCTGNDFLKPYLYALENESLTGNFCGLTFTQAYISDYSVVFSPNSPIEISANINIFDKISGNFNATSPINQTGLILRVSDIKIDNLSNYTTTSINNIVQATFAYNCKLNPSYSYDSGEPIFSADRVSLEDRRWDIEIISDSTNLDIPISGENFGITISGVNPFNNLINESFSASGVIYSKQINISNNKVHSHILKLSQNHASNNGDIALVTINTGFNVININSTLNSHPFTNQSLSCIDKIIVGDTICTGFSVIKNSFNDSINIPIPNNIINGPLSIFSSKGNFFWPNILTFNYPNITITGISQRTGYPGTPIYISGNNFYRISQVNYGGVSSNFQTISPNLILSIVPKNGITNKIQLISNTRNVTGYTNDYFYCQPSISLLTPVTGIWKDSMIVGGLNFSGTTGVAFGTGMVNAFSTTILSNTTLSIQSPDVGAGFPEGYVTIMTSGGSTQSISKYTPQVPLYGFNPASGIYFNGLGLSLIVDSGYLYPTGGGYKIRFGTMDTIFYQNGTGLTGQVPFGGQTDYIYIYKPDGVSTYTVNPTKYIVHSIPQIFSVTPAIINQYRYFSPVLIGQNFEFFTSNVSYFFAISGGINGDMQTGKNMIANSGGNADTLYIPNLIITGGTGYYDILVQNFAGTGFFKSGLLVSSGINQSSNSKANIVAPNNQLGRFNAALSIDNSTGTFAGLKCTVSVSGTSLNIVSKNNNLFNLSLIKILVNTGDASDSNGVLIHDVGTTYKATTTGSLSLWYKNANKPFFDTNMVDFSLQQNNTYILFNSGITGLATIKIFTPKVTNTDLKYLGITEVQMY